jgi:uncharacterized protein (DUF2267 family)
MGPVLGATTDVLHAALMAAWVLGLPLLYWHRWPHLSRAFAIYAIAFVVVNQVSQLVLGECFLTTLARMGWQHEPGWQGRVHASGEWFTVRLAYAVFRLTPSHRSIKVATEALILVTAVGLALRGLPPPPKGTRVALKPGMNGKMMATEEELLDKIVALAGLDTTREAERALRATLAALGELLPEKERRAFADALPSRLGMVLEMRKHHGPFGLEEFFGHVQRREVTSAGFAREHAQVVCRVLGEALPDDARARLERAVPAEYVDLFRGVSRDTAPPPTHPVEPGARHHSLATGKPGSRHPVSEAHPDSAHTHSLAREDDPHGDTKLSSASGLTQERLDESLATNVPDPSRRIGRAPS